MKKKKEIKEKVLKEKFILASVILITLFVLGFVFADPVSPNSMSLISNETAASNGAQTINISGGYIATLNINATIQNPHWKAFVGNVTGSFTLDDASGATIYDWTLSSITGRVYATRNSSSITWTGVNCSNFANLSAESVKMNHTNPDDSINVTFNSSSGATHSAFYVGSRYIYANSCPTLNTYIASASQDTDFEEIALQDTYMTIIYATILEQNLAGFDGNTYDFQMIVPENGLVATTATPYYIYVEIS